MTDYCKGDQIHKYTLPMQKHTNTQKLIRQIIVRETKYTNTPSCNAKAHKYTKGNLTYNVRVTKRRYNLCNAKAQKQI